MTRITHVLCPIDFSEFSRHAVDHAAAIARWYRARLTVLYVAVVRPELELPAISMSDEERAQVIAHIRRFVSHVSSGVPIEARVEEGFSVHEEVLRQAELMGANLLVVGSHGRSGFERLLLGLVTERLLHKAQCPTLVVPRRAADVDPDAPVQFRRILCPVDFSRARTVHWPTRRWQTRLGASTVVNVIEIPPELREPPAPEGIDVDCVRAAAEADCLQRLRHLIPESARRRETIETGVREGAAYREILKLAVEGQADLIVMGVHGRGAVDLLVFGSNTARSSALPIVPC